MASRKSHCSGSKEGSTVWRKQPPDGFSQELFTKMSKKIAQLTKVIFTLNTRVEDQDALIQAMKEFHEESMQKIMMDAKEKIAQCQSKMNREVDLLQQVGQLESELLQEREDRTRLQLDMELLRRRVATASEPGTCRGKCMCVSRNQQIVALYQDIRAAGDAFRRKVDDFERLHFKMMLALENGYQNGGCLMASPETTGALVRSDCDSKSLAAIYEAECEQVAKKNEFLREQCDRLVSENAKIRRDFEEKLTVLKTFYEDSLLKIKSSQKLELANDFSLACCEKQDSMDKTYDKLDVNFRRRVDELLLQLSKSEEDVERYSKELKHMCEELEKREKHLKVMDDQVNCGKEEQQKLLCRLKQSEAALNQTKSSCSQHKQELINKNDKISMLEATKSEQEATIYRLQTEIVALKDKLRDIAVLREDNSRLQTQLKEYEASMDALQTAHQRELLAKDRKVEDVERMLQTSKEESRCLKAIQEQLKAALQEAQSRNEELSRQLKERIDCLSAGANVIRILRHDVKNLKVQLKDTIEEHESSLQVSQKKLRQKENELNKTWQQKLSSELVKERETLSIHGEQERARVMDILTAEKEACIRSLDQSWSEKYQELSTQLARVKAELEKVTTEFQSDLHSKAAKWNLEKQQLEQQLSNSAAEFAKRLKEVTLQHSTAMATLVTEKEAIIQDLKLQQQMELERQATGFKQTSEKQKLESDVQHREEKEKLIQVHAAQLEELQKKLTEEQEHAKALTCQSHQAEVQKLKADLERAQQQIRSKEQTFSEKERSLRQNIAQQTWNIKQLQTSFDKFRNDADAATQELESKKDEILKVRSEATQQIKNLELYWQRRITKELKDNAAKFEREKNVTLQKFSKTQQLLKDKISSLESMINQHAKQGAPDGPLPVYKTIEVSAAGYNQETGFSRSHVTASSTSYVASALCSPRLLKRAQNFSESSCRSLLPRRPSLPATNAPPQDGSPATPRSPPMYRASTQTPSYASSRFPEANPSLASPELLRRLKSPEPPTRIASLESSRCPELQRKRSVWFSDGPRPGMSTEAHKPDVAMQPKRTSRDHDSHHGKDGEQASEELRSSAYSIPRMIGDTFRRMRPHRKEDSGATEGDAKRNGSRFYTSLSKSPRFARGGAFGTIREADETAPDKASG